LFNNGLYYLVARTDVICH